MQLWRREGISGTCAVSTSKYTEARRLMNDTLMDIWIFSRNRLLDVSESLLLAPSNEYNCISRKDDRQIKEALFKFLASVDRRT